jgi:hypothetical protein
MTAEEDKIKDDLIEKIMEQLEIITRNMKGRDEEL